jgi:hypothetical protein
VNRKLQADTQATFKKLHKWDSTEPNAGARWLAAGRSITKVTDLQRASADLRLDRTAIADVFLDGKDLVLLGHDSNELAQEKTDRPAARLADAFGRHGYPWRAEGDPRASQFRLWSETARGLPAAARPMLSMRARALKEKKAADAADLRAELINLGVVVRHEGGKQYWRLTDRPTDSLDA